MKVKAKDTGENADVNNKFYTYVGGKCSYEEVDILEVSPEVLYRNEGYTNTEYTGYKKEEYWTNQKPMTK